MFSPVANQSGTHARRFQELYGFTSSLDLLPRGATCLETNVSPDTLRATNGTLHYNQQGDTYRMRRIDDRQLCVTGHLSPLLGITDPLSLMIPEADPYMVSPAPLDFFFPRDIDSSSRWLHARLTPLFSRCLTMVNPHAWHLGHSPWVNPLSWDLMDLSP